MDRNQNQSNNYDTIPRPVEEECCEPGLAAPVDLIPRNIAKDITIESLDHGYIVRVGCQRFASEDAEKMLKLIGTYLEDPNGVEQKWFKKEFKL